MTADTALPDPDAPWLRQEDVAKPGKTFVYRVRYVLNQIEVLEQLSKAAPNKFLVRPAEGGSETWIEGHEVFPKFEEARARLVMLNEERIRLIQMDLARAQVKLDVSQCMFLAEEDELPDPDEDQP